MAVSALTRTALETARSALAEIVAAAPEKEPHYRDYVAREDEWGRGCAN
ncbi:hypothetical protein LPC10_01880 [Methylorubrum sp. B1-46]|nr:hypothetical protein [Methylorubrum sp. B1-46]UGB26390.1 hypothetical protein LPC10_01880 [Methylorubrum sp. B1-46]